MTERIERLGSMDESIDGVHSCRKAAMHKNPRQLLHYLGMAIQGVGLLMFASLFLNFARRFGDFNDFDRRMQTQATIGFLSMALIVAGKLLCFGVVRGAQYLDRRSDPNHAQPRFTPFTRMKSGTQHDPKDDGRLPLGRQPETIVLFKCRRCGETSGEKAKFCQACGEKL